MIKSVTLTRTIYYTDELNDEFAGDTIAARKIGGGWVYVRNSPWKKFTRFFWYRLLAFPPAKLWMLLHFHHKIVNRRVFRQIGRTGFFMYGNHTHNLCDALIPTLISVPKDVFVIVHPNNVSMPVLGRLTPSLGAIPLPDDRASAKNFLACIGTRIREGKCVTIYPEAHIWPYYTKIRPFTSASFRYPVQYGVPVVCFTNTYQRRGRSETPRIVTYVDGPFYPDRNLSAAGQREALRDQCYAAMTERAKNSNVEVIRYVKAPAAPPDE